MARNRASISYQMTSGISKCTHEGGSKRSYKSSHNGDIDYHVFGLTYKNDLCETAKELAHYLRVEYKDILYVRDITPDMIQGFLTYKKESGAYSAIMEYARNHKCKRIGLLEHYF